MVILRACVQCGRLSDGARCEEHRPRPWAGSTRRDRVRSGWAQQRRARAVIRMHDGVCHRCGAHGSRIADHVVALAEGGADDIANMAPICDRCNRVKVAEEAARGRERARRGTVR